MTLPTLREYQMWKYSGENSDIVNYADTVRSQNPHLQIPYYPEESDYIRRYSCNSSDMKIVSDYTNLDFNQIYDLNIFVYWGWLHDTVVWNCEKSLKGRDYLDKCWTNSQTEPDRIALREIFGK